MGPDAQFVGVPVIRKYSGSTLIIGKRFMAVSTSRHQVMGVNHAVVLKTVSERARLIIGNDFGASGNSIICAHSITIGDGVMLGANSVVVDTDFHPVHDLDRRYKPLPVSSEKDSVFIGSNVFVGANAIILKGSAVGNNSVVGAGAVVTGKFGDNTIIAGNPAREVGKVAE